MSGSVMQLRQKARHLVSAAITAEDSSNSSQRLRINGPVNAEVLQSLVEEPGPGDHPKDSSRVGIPSILWQG